MRRERTSIRIAGSVPRRVSFLREARKREREREGKGERRDSPWIGGRERPRARRRTAGCVTQSPVHRQRASAERRGGFVSSLSVGAHGGGLSRGVR